MIAIEDLILVSVDDHLIEPPDLFAVPDDHVRKITHENAMRWYSFGRAERAVAAAAASGR